jgi:hypothetical protein
MKIDWLLTLAGLVMISDGCSFAQQSDATDPQIAQQIRALTLQYEKALNEHDAKAAAAFFTEDAVWTTPQGKTAEVMEMPTYRPILQISKFWAGYQ